VYQTARVEVFKKGTFFQIISFYRESNSKNDSRAFTDADSQLLVEDKTEQRTVHLQPAVVFDEAKLSKSVQEDIHV
jgi:hypothetical protein